MIKLCMWNWLLTIILIKSFKPASQLCGCSNGFKGGAAVQLNPLFDYVAGAAAGDKHFSLKYVSSQISQIRCKSV